MKVLPDGKGVLLEDPADYGGSVWFRGQAIERFPELTESLMNDVCGFHITMAKVADVIRSACGSGKPEDALAGLQWLDGILANPRADSEIENAVCISFIEAPELRDGSASERKVWKEMPDNIRKIMVEQENRWQNAGK